MKSQPDLFSMYAQLSREIRPTIAEVSRDREREKERDRRKSAEYRERNRERMKKARSKK